MFQCSLKIEVTTLTSACAASCCKWWLLASNGALQSAFASRDGLSSVGVVGAAVLELATSRYFGFANGVLMGDGDRRKRSLSRYSRRFMYFSALLTSIVGWKCLCRTRYVRKIRWNFWQICTCATSQIISRRAAFATLWQYARHALRDFGNG